ncbi:hypothetical protein FJT64_021768 [Amphibalanus amphitrite]|uniref:Hemolymph juvenile hormone binding protein n=1 Tax=Amphibalanus amphitrite TaxID=1232801 RepID=A0A6A4WSM2_AMPAM|nr:uncharacterized protein LOC122364379 [Amphibalanus amphitrite]XP_043245085.1 uncharacterized protein LOC122393270 [Amphibalanus amphitrite]KAF0306804.1 hypothetical protein FJT64_021768 [Amphibalanus amphitrite]
MARLLAPALLGCCLLALSSGMPFLPEWLAEMTELNSFELSFTPTKEEDASRIRREAEIKVEDVIREVIGHFKKDDPRGLPGSLVPDPLSVPAKIDQTVAGADVNLQDMILTGLKYFELRDVKVDLSAQEFRYEIFFKSLTALGKYKLYYFWSNYNGDFNITLEDIKAEGKGILEVSTNGTVQLNDVTTDVGFGDIDVVFHNLGGLGYIIQGAVNMMGTFLFDAIKPLTLDKVNEALAKNVNEQLRALNEEILFSDSIPVLDVAVLQVRKMIRDEGYDPLELPSVERSNSMGVQITLTEGSLTGLSTVHRTGEISVGMQEYTAKTTVALGTQRITGRYHWRVSAFGFLERNGFIRFSVDSLKLRARLAQPLNLSQKPRIEDLDIDLGTLTLRSEGAGSLDYAFELGVNSFPNLFKNIVIDAIERPLMWVIGSQLQELDMEQLVLDNIPGGSVVKAAR